MSEPSTPNRVPGLLVVAAGAALLVVSAVATAPAVPTPPPGPRVTYRAPERTTRPVLELQVQVTAATEWVDLTVGEQTTRVAPGAHALQVALEPGENEVEVWAVDAAGRRSPTGIVRVTRARPSLSDLEPAAGPAAPR